jgi:hypothetical protein
MDHLIKDLRLAIAQFNTFIIENYILNKNEINNNSEPHSYLFNTFKILSTGLGDYGEYLGKIDIASYRNSLSELQKSLIEHSIITIYIIEKSVDEADLRSVINSINAYFFQTSINNVLKYSEIYKTDIAVVKEEIDQLIKDNSEYFTKEGTTKCEPYYPSIDEAVSFLVNNTHLPQFKTKFKKTITSHNFFNNYINNDDTIYNKSKNGLLYYLLDSLYIVLLALTYIEPFYEKDEEINNEFFEGMTNLFKLQTESLKKY